MTQRSISTNPREEVLLLRPSHGLGALNLRDLWVYRELVYFLTWRDIKVRYKQTILGASWAILQPLIQMVVFSIIFGGMAKIASEGVPYPIFNFTALLPWGLFAKALNDAGRSLVTNRNMITKVYFPRMVIPVASVLSGILDFLIGSLVLVGIILYYRLSPAQNYQITPTPALLALPIFFLLSLVTALGTSLWLSAMNVLYRDVGHVLPFLTQTWFFVSPTVYASSAVPEQWLWIYYLNPMAAVIEGFRWSILGTPLPATPMLMVSILVALVLLITGMFYFRRMERTFADMI